MVGDGDMAYAALLLLKSLSLSLLKTACIAAAVVILRGVYAAVVWVVFLIGSGRFSACAMLMLLVFCAKGRFAPAPWCCS